MCVALCTFLSWRKTSVFVAHFGLDVISMSHGSLPMCVSHPVHCCRDVKHLCPFGLDVTMINISHGPLLMCVSHCNQNHGLRKPINLVCVTLCVWRFINNPRRTTIVGDHLSRKAMSTKSNISECSMFLLARVWMTLYQPVTSHYNFGRSYANKSTVNKSTVNKSTVNKVKHLGVCHVLTCPCINDVLSTIHVPLQLG